jgi:hypothetical protein
MDTISAQPLTDFEQHQLEMLRWHAEIHERNGKKQEASKIRTWVADFLGSQSEFNEESDGVFTSDFEGNQEDCSVVRFNPSKD